MSNLYIKVPPKVKRIDQTSEIKKKKKLPAKFHGIHHFRNTLAFLGVCLPEKLSFKN